MSFQKISVFVTALLTLGVIVMGVVMYVQLSEIRELREDIASLQQATEVENQGLREELASLRTEMTELDASEDLAAIQKSISRLRLQSLGVWVDDEPLVSLQMPQIARPGLSVSNMPSLQPGAEWWWEQYPDTVRNHAERLRLRVALRNRRGPPGVPWGRRPRGCRRNRPYG